MTRGNLIAVAWTLLQPVAVCHGWLTVPPAHPGSDLHGGAITQQLPRCRLP